MDVSPNPPMECYRSLAATKKFIKLSNGCMRLLLDNGAGLTCSASIGIADMMKHICKVGSLSASFNLTCL